MRDMNVARLTAKDVPLFEGIMQDIFPDVVIPTLDYEVLETAIAAEMKMAGLQPVKAALHKVVQLYETKVWFCVKKVANSCPFWYMVGKKVEIRSNIFIPVFLNS